MPIRFRNTTKDHGVYVMASVYLAKYVFQVFFLTDAVRHDRNYVNVYVPKQGIAVAVNYRSKSLMNVYFVCSCVRILFIRFVIKLYGERNVLFSS